MSSLPTKRPHPTDTSTTTPDPAPNPSSTAPPIPSPSTTTTITTTTTTTTTPLSPSPTAPAHRCPTCSRTFKRNWHLTRHEQSHSTDRPFKCPLCARVFARQDTLGRHVGSCAKLKGKGRVGDGEGGGRGKGEVRDERRLEGGKSRFSAGLGGAGGGEKTAGGVGGEEMTGGGGSGGGGGGGTLRPLMPDTAGTRTFSGQEENATSARDRSILSQHVQMSPMTEQSDTVAQAKGPDNSIIQLPEWTPEQQLAMETASAAAATPYNNGHTDTGLTVAATLPEDLYSSKVDLQARQWLRGLMTQDRGVSAVSPGD